MANVLYYEDIQLVDGVKCYFGTGSDLEIFHNGSQAYIENYTGELNFTQHVNNGYMRFKCDDGSGGTTTYLTLDGGLGYTTVQKDIRFEDNVQLEIGDGRDLVIYSDGTNGLISNQNGTLYITQANNDEDIILSSDDGSGGTTAYLTLDGSLAQMWADKKLQFSDNISATFGASNDLQLYHNGSHSIITNQTGDLYIRNQTNDGDIIFQADDGSGGDATYFQVDGQYEVNRFLKNARFNDSVKANFGTVDDLQIYHDGSNSYIDDTGTGDLKIRGETNIYIGATTGGANMAQFIKGGAVKLRFNDSNKFETTSTGVGITGNADVSSNVLVGSADSYFGENVLRFKPAGAAYIDHNTVGQSLVFRTSNSSSLDTNALTITSAGYATFVQGIQATNTSFSGTMNIAGGIYHIGDTNTYFGFDEGNDKFRVVTGGSERLGINNSGVRIGGGARVTTILDEDDMATDSATALATQQSIKAYVDNKVTGVLTYQGTWNASTNSPTLSSGSGTPGYYYIVSTAGSTNLDGITDWAVGDWAVFSDQATDAWQKIDNTAVGNVSGSGTANDITMWSGAGTITDAPISVSGNDVNFAGKVGVGIAATDQLEVAGNIRANVSNAGGFMLTASSASGLVRNNATGVALRTNTTDRLIIDNSGNTTITGNLTFGDSHIIGDDGDDNLLIQSSAGENIILDSADDIVLDVDGGDIKLKDGGTQWGSFYTGGGGTHMYIESYISDKDIIFKGNDGGSTITALTLDMSDAGAAEFGTRVYIPEYIAHSGDSDTLFGFSGANTYIVNTGGTTALTINSSQDATFAGRIDVAGGDVNIQAGALSITADGSNKATLTETGAGLLTIATEDDLILDAASDITLDAGGNDIRLFNSGVEYGKFKSDSSDLAVYSSIQDKDIIFKGNDGGSTIDALTLDMSAAGAAIFNDLIYAPSYIVHTGDIDTKIGFNTADNVEIRVGGNLQISASASRAYLRYQGSNKIQTDSAGVNITGGLTTTASSDMAGLNMTSNIAMGDNNISGVGDFTVGGAMSVEAGGDTTIDGELKAEGGLVVTGNTTASGNVVLNGDSNIVLDTSVSSTQSSGTLIKIGSHMSALVAGNIYYAGNSMGNLYWYGADADSSSTENMLALSVGTDADVDGMLLNGIYHKASHGLTVGEPIYLSTTSMSMTNTAPSGSGDYVRVLGYALDSNHIYFCPDNTWVKID